MKERNLPLTAPEASTPLSFLTPRDSTRAQKARGAHKAIGYLRLILPLASVLALIGLIAWPLINPDKLMSRAFKNMPNLVIKNLNFTDVDSNNQPYSISAAKATRPAGDKEIYDLDQPQGEITLKQGAWLAAKSQQGRYDKEKNQLWLGGDVQLFHDQGMEITTDELQADLDRNTFWGEKPIRVHGSFGEVRGKGFKVLDSGNVFVVNGPVKAILNLQAAGASVKPAKVK